MANILVVDDRAINRHFLVTLLGYAGHSTLEASDGAEALLIARSSQPQLVISDVLMPTMDGVEFANRLHAEPGIAHIPIIFYTATYRLKEARVLAESCGVTAVLTKPAEPQAIIDAVNNALGIGQTSPASVADALRGAPPLRPPDRFSGPLSELEQMRLRMQQAIDFALSLVGERGELQQITDRLLQSLDTVQAMSLKLSALIEVGIELASERNIDMLLEKFAGALQDVLGAKYAGVGIVDDGGSTLRHFLIRGVSEETRAAIGNPDARNGALQELLGAKRVFRFNGASKPDVGLPSAHPPTTSFLAVRIESSTRTYGWLYVADKLGRGEFNLDDEQLASTMAASLALHYENVTLLAASKESELRFRQLAENLREVFFLISADGSQMLYISPEYERIWGRSCASLYQNPLAWTEAIHPDDKPRILAMVEQRTETGSFEYEYRIVRPDGTLRTIRARGFGVLDEAGALTRIAGLAEDVTEQKRAEDEIRQLNAELEHRVIERTRELSEANKDLDAFSSSVSHDLRAPLTKIHGFTQMLLEDCGDKLDLDSLRHLQTISRNVTGMGQLIDDLLAFSRMGREPIDAMRVNMSAMAKEVTAELAVGARNGNAPELRIGQLPPAWGDAALLRQVWINLLGNALKYSEHAPHPVVEVSGTAEGGECCYRIKDNGAGFDMRYAGKLFEAFQRLHSASQFPGTGMGLAIVHRIVTRHGGRVWAEGREGEGATFYFALPAQRGK